MDQGTWQFAWLIVSLLLIVGSRVMSERALSALSASDKARLVDGFSKQRIYILVPVIALLVLNYAAIKLAPERTTEIVAAVIALTVALLVVGNVLAVRKLRSLGLPGSYIRKYLASRAVSLVAMMLLVGSVFYNPFAHGA
ncbi:hypothetical protein WMF37_39400 [Sorangium sp. So ce291]|uniref:hypothetical protein n=1 Tax=Sorangium sp. So ce291 TaxID=3133294 RepID=UPI003F5E8964